MCLFCGGPLGAARAREHVLPRWLLDHLGIRASSVSPTHMRPDGTVVTERKHDLNNFLAGRVCKVCNNGWMSQLEGQAKRLLIPLMAGEREVVELDEAERQLLATWAFKTAIVLNNASNFHANVPAGHFRALGADPTRPADAVRVYGQ